MREHVTSNILRISRFFLHIENNCTLSSNMKGKYKKTYYSAITLSNILLIIVLTKFSKINNVRYNFQGNIIYIINGKFSKKHCRR